MDKIAVLIPCYNEEKTIKKVIDDWKKELPEATIYVYNNNSTDHTAQIAKDAGVIVRDEYQQGKGNVIRRMFREIDAQCYIMIDGDDTYPAEFGREMAEKVLERKVDWWLETDFHQHILKKISVLSTILVIVWYEERSIVCLKVI